MKNYFKSLLCFGLVMLMAEKSFSQDDFKAIPRIIRTDNHYTLLVDGKPYFMLGGQAHNSSGWPGELPKVWAAVEQMHLNTLEIPVYWEQIEPQQGKFDFSIVDTLLNQSRQHHVRLVLLWFATWKNGSNHYMPEWMKQNAIKYPNIIGVNGQFVDSPSPNFAATLNADINAFKEVMKYLKKADTEHTVIMMQVENETGAWGSVRDYSPLAQKLFESNVPSVLLKPEVLKALNVLVVQGGTWQKVFGERADEYFQAWSVARFVGQVAAAGKAEYPLPMYVNTALREPFGNPAANTYESGGPTDNVIPIWKIAAPELDLLAPDIYLQGSKNVLKVLELYTRADNPLFVPESALFHDNVKYLYEVIARNGIGFSPFGIDDNGKQETSDETAARLEPFAKEYRLFTPMMREIAQWNFDGRIVAAVERDDRAGQTIDLGAWQAVVSFGTGGGGGPLVNNPKPTGKLLVVKLTGDKFLLIGSRCHVTFKPTGVNSGKAWQYLKVEEGYYDNGQFIPLRNLNGDETDWGGPRFGDQPVILQTSLVVR